MSDPANAATSTSATSTGYAGRCHCGAVRFEVALGASFKGNRCNCTICTKIAATESIVRPLDFRLLAGESELGRYQRKNGNTARFFCKHCGVHCYGSGHQPELGGDFIAVNLNCLDEVDVDTVEIDHWDGRHDNWAAGPRRAPWPR